MNMNTPTAYRQNAPANPQVQQAIMAYAEKMDMPPEGVDILGGKPYPNATGLLTKARKLGLKGIKVDLEREATKENGMSAKAKATVFMSDGSYFEEMGLASPISVPMKTLHNPDFLSQMAITRAKNRALRSATGVGHTSAEEMKDAYDMYAETTRLDLPPGSGIDRTTGEVFETPNDDLPDHLRHKAENEAEDELQKAELPPVKKAAPAKTMDVPPPAPDKSPEFDKFESVVKLRKTIKEAGKDEAKILDYFKKERLEDLTPDEYKVAMENLTMTIAQNVMNPPANKPTMEEFYQDVPPVNA